MPGTPQVDFKILFEPLEASSFDQQQDLSESDEGDKGGPKMPKGKFSVRITNLLPDDLLDCWIVIGVTTSAQGSEALYQEYSRWGRQSPDWAKYGGMVDVYQFVSLQSIHAGKEFERSFDASFSQTSGRWDREWSWKEGALAPPRISRLGTATAWVIGRLKDSPSLAIHEDGCDFIKHEELHLFVQEIRPEDMPASNLFLDRDALPNKP